MENNITIAVNLDPIYREFIMNGGTDNTISAFFKKRRAKGTQAEIIKTIGYDQKEMISNILKLHCPSGIDLDCTYSKGSFYKNAPYSEPTYKSDIMPKYDDVIEADAKALPFEDSCFKCVMFDPPFLPGKTKENEATSIMLSRFSGFHSVSDVWEFYSGALKEIYRVLATKGILIFKCQDTSNSLRQCLSHVYIVNEAEKLGFYVKDLFVLLAKHRIIGHNHRNQKHARKYHSYFLVLEKKNKACVPIHSSV